MGDHYDFEQKFWAKNKGVSQGKILLYFQSQNKAKGSKKKQNALKKAKMASLFTVRECAQ